MSSDWGVWFQVEDLQIQKPVGHRWTPIHTDEKPVGVAETLTLRRVLCRNSQVFVLTRHTTGLPKTELRSVMRFPKLLYRDSLPGRVTVPAGIESREKEESLMFRLLSIAFLISLMTGPAMAQAPAAVAHATRPASPTRITC